MAYSVGKNSNSTASLRVKQLQLNFQRFCQMELTKIYTKKITKIDKNAKKTCSLRCQARVVMMYITNRYMLQKPNACQVMLT